MAGFPARLATAHAELAAVAAADELDRGSLAAAERYLSLAEQASASAPEERRGQLRLLLGVVRLLLARQRGDLPAVAEEAQRLQALADTPDAAPPALGKELRTLTLISLGSAEYWAARFDEAELRLERGAALAQQIGRPFLELTGLAYQAATEFNRSLTRSAERSRQAVELAERHGWADEPAAGPAYMMLGAVLAWQVRPEEAEPWVQRAERTVRAEADPAAALGVQHLRGVLELARGRDLRAVAAFQATERLARQLAVPHLLVTQARALLLLRLPIPLELARGGFPAGGDHKGRTRRPHRRGARPGTRTRSRRTRQHALVVPAAAGASPARAACPAPHQPRLADHRDRQPAGRKELRVTARRPWAPLEPLSGTEIRVMRYLPTNLTGPEIAWELSISRNTVKTHIRNLYAKLGTHTRAEAVTRARALGLLAPPPRTG